MANWTLWFESDLCLQPMWIRVKVLSHWRRRRRDLSVAATRSTRETKKWLVLSPRQLLRDVSRGDNQFARKSRGRRHDVSGSRGDISETSSQLRGRLRQLRPYLIGLETRWRLESPLVAMSPWCLRDLLETSPQRLLSLLSLLGLQQVSETSRRRLRYLLETGKSLQNIEHVWISRDAPETRLVSKRRRGDSSCHLVAT